MLCFSATRTPSPVRGLRPTRASRRLTEKAPNPRSSTRSPRASAGVAISSKIAVTMTSTSRWYRVRVGLGQPQHELRFRHRDLSPPSQRIGKGAKTAGRRSSAPQTFIIQGSTAPRRFRQESRCHTAGAQLFFGVALPIGVQQARAVDRCPQNIAKAGARIRRASLGRRAFFLVDLARLDRQPDLARGSVDHGDLGIDLFADGEPLRPLLAAVVARQSPTCG